MFRFKRLSNISNLITPLLGVSYEIMQNKIFMCFCVATSRPSLDKLAKTVRKNMKKVEKINNLKVDQRIGMVN